MAIFIYSDSDWQSQKPYSAERRKRVTNRKTSVIQWPFCCDTKMIVIRKRVPFQLIYLIWISNVTLKIWPLKNILNVNCVFRLWQKQTKLLVQVKLSVDRPRQTKPTTTTKLLRTFCYVTEPLHRWSCKFERFRYSINLKLFSFEFWNLFVTLFYDF